MSNWLPDTKPGWWRSLSNDPTKFIISRVADWLVGIVLGIAAQTADITFGMFDTVAGAFSMAFGGALNAVSPIGAQVVYIIISIQGTIVDIARLTGPLEPVVLIAIVVGLMVLAWRATVALIPMVEGVLDVVPVLGPIATGLIEGARSFFGGGS